LGGTPCEGVVEDVEATPFAEPQGVPPIQNINSARRVTLTRRAVFIDTFRVGRTSVALPRILPHVQMLAFARRWRSQGTYGCCPDSTFLPPASSTMATSTTPKKRKTGSAVQTPLETYLREINETALLSAKEEKELATSIGQGDTAARDRMVRANLRLVVNIARGYSGKGLGLQDLIEEGNLGLLRAVEGFDPAMGTRFSTYASYWIKQSIKRALINTGKTIRIPAYMVELLSKWRRATARLTEELGRTPTPEEIARVLGLAKKKLPIIKKAIKIYNATPQTDQSEAGWTLGDMVMDERQMSPDDALVESDCLHHVMDMLTTMDQREATVLRMRFGLDSHDPRTLKEIGEQLGLTRERVRQIETEALNKMADSMEDPRERMMGDLDE
jgi:RNA polymerase primary sigma factor